ncbi:hypothetical protein FRC07_001800 [Ceratobasidium sp. 392]|nr:hypothetical protein FRC07_001800 [Ceratobasidium sp. 392]
MEDVEGFDPGSLDTFLHMNDMNNNALERYEPYQKGDYTAVVEHTPSTSSVAPTSDLIDFLGDDSATVAAPSGPANDLDGLFGPASTPAFATTPSPPLAQHADSRASIMAAFNQQPTHAFNPQPAQPQFGQFGTGAGVFAGSGTSSPFVTSTPGAQGQNQFGGGIMSPSTPRPGSATPPAPSAAAPS